MTTTPVTLDPSTLASDALTLMESRQITSVVVVHPDRTVAGVLHIHDLLRAGVL
jgi:arabinose-5-phosphate isomerase